MHDCEATREALPDLLLGGEGLTRSAPPPEEVGACEECRAEHRALADTLDALDAALAAALPGEQFWTGYDERLRARMAQEIGANLWPAAAALSPLRGGEFRLTILEDAGLLGRLVAELKNVARESELTWPEFRRDPLGFTRRVAAGYGRLLRRAAAQDYAFQSVLAPLCLIALAASVWAAAENRCRFLSLFSAQRCEQALDENPYRDLQVIGMIGGEIPSDQETPEKAGAAGLNKSKGGGSTPNRERPGGGGGGGRESDLPTSQGKVAQASPQEQILTPSVRPALKNPALAVEPTLKGDPLLLPRDPREIAFGDPNSASPTPSDGPGKGEGQGTGEGTGQGPGGGRGYGPGHDENTGNGGPRYGGDGPGGPGGEIDYRGKIFKAPEVSRRAVITYRPEPNFTEAARRNNVTGVVRLRAVLTAAGQVTNITVLKGLPDGLTEKAIEAARQIRFTPAQKSGRAVSQWVVVEYNFNIY